MSKWYNVWNIYCTVSADNESELDKHEIEIKSAIQKIIKQRKLDVACVKCTNRNLFIPGSNKSWSDNDFETDDVEPGITMTIYVENADTMQILLDHFDKVRAKLGVWIMENEKVDLIREEDLMTI